MSLVAGVDIGNSTTEIVIADATLTPPRVVATERAPTRGAKGSAESGRAAATLLARTVRRLGLDVDVAFLTPQRPVHTARMDIPAVPADLGRLSLVAAGASTPAGSGLGVGRPVPVEASPLEVRQGPIVLVAQDPLGFRSTAAAVTAWLAVRSDVVGVLLAGDEAALVSTRIASGVPVVDCVDAATALNCEWVALEVAPPGQQVTTLADPLWLANALDLAPGEHQSARAATGLIRGLRDAVIGRLSSGRPPEPAPDRGSVTLVDSGDVNLADARPLIANRPIPSVRALRPPGSPTTAVDDLWLVDLADLGSAPGTRAGSLGDRALVVSSLSAGTPSDAGIEAFRATWSGQTAVVADETSAARRGTLTTPGASADAWVLDLGGGTADVIGPRGRAISAAGSGELLTAATTHALGISVGAAEWVKRGPASRVDAPHVVSDESGERRFLEASAPHGTVGWLVAAGPGGALPFSRSLALAEWRGMRIALKRFVFADNLTRMLSSVPTAERPTDVIVTGGPAGDDELLDALAPALGSATLGRARVAGTLDHRWAVAYGLVLWGVLGE